MCLVARVQESTLLRLAERQAGREEELVAARQKASLIPAVTLKPS